MTDDREFKILHLFGGIGGGALGFDIARDEFRGVRGRFRLIGSVDVDAGACADFATLVGREQTRGDISTMIPNDLRRACGNEAPDAVFLSPPCKGFSGLISTKKSQTEKYRKLNRLVLQGLRLVLAAFPDELPSLILLENVPRIAQRGKHLLNRVKRLLETRGYVFHEGFHDCGEIGGLGQRRRRFLLVARLPEKVPNVLHRPPSKNLRTIGDVLGPLPLPEAEAGGAMHKLPRLEWRTWERLALIPAGGDWRDLEEYAPLDPREERARRREAKAVKAAPVKGGLFNGALGVQDWNKPGRSVIGGRSNGAATVADPRWRPRRGTGAYGIVPWNHPAETVIGKGPGSGPQSVADPRFGSTTGRNTKLRVEDWDKPSKTIIGQTDVQTGALSVADPRFADRLGVSRWEDPAATVKGESYPSNGRHAVADPRVREHFGNSFRVDAWDKPSGTVTGQNNPSNGGKAVADPRIPNVETWPAYGVARWDEAMGTVTGARAPGQGKISVADPRMPDGPKYNNVFRVVRWDEPSVAVTGGGHPTAGGICVGDPRFSLGAHHNKMRVEDWKKPAHTVTGSDRVGSGAPSVADPRAAKGYRNGAFRVTPFDEPSSTVTSKANPSHEGAISVADPRLGCEPRKGTMGVIPWDRPASTVTGSGDIHAGGAAAVADPRVPVGAPGRIPAPRERLLEPPIIIALDGTWHRPLTTYELAALQGFPLEVNAKPIVLAGTNQSHWRERIGNAVPPPAAAAIACAMIRTLLVAASGSWELSSDEVWVLPDNEDDPSLGIDA